MSYERQGSHVSEYCPHENGELELLRNVAEAAEGGLGYWTESDSDNVREAVHAWQEWKEKNPSPPRDKGPDPAVVLGGGPG